MKSISMLLALFAIVLLVGCKSTNVNKASDPLQVNLEVPNYRPEMEQVKKVSGEATLHRVLFFTWGDTKYVDNMNFGTQNTHEANFLFAQLFSFFGRFMTIDSEKGKGAASYKACDDNNVDAVIAPMYTVDRENYVVYERAVFNVKGIGAKLKGVKENGYILQGDSQAKTR